MQILGAGGFEIIDCRSGNTSRTLTCSQEESCRTSTPQSFPDDISGPAQIRNSIFNKSQMPQTRCLYFLAFTGNTALQTETMSTEILICRGPKSCKLWQRLLSRFLQGLCHGSFKREHTMATPIMLFKSWPFDTRDEIHVTLTSPMTHSLVLLLFIYLKLN